MMRIKAIFTIITEYGISWVVYRSLYVVKLKAMSLLPFIEGLFERDASIRRIDIFSPCVPQIRDSLNRGSDETRDSLLHTADEALQGRILGFSSVWMDYGYPLDWQLNPLTGLRCSETEKWFRIADFDESRGDIKAIWEASRFTHFYSLARAFLLTGDKKYYNGFSDQLADWLRCNPYSFGANYKCGQECALRMVNALIVYTVFKDCGVASEKDEKNIQTLITLCYKKILSNFFYAHRCIKNNHTISELMGMIVGAWCCEDTQKLNKAYCLLDKTIMDQFTEDGGYCQHSFNYQRLALQAIAHILSVSEKTGKAVSEHSLQRVQAAAQLLYQCMVETGEVPNYGSNDGALIFPVTSCHYGDFRPCVNVINVMIQGKCLWTDESTAEALRWHGLRESYASEAVVRKSGSYKAAGLFSLRDGQTLIMVVLDNYVKRPAHMDQLHLDVWRDSVNILCDSGTYSYSDPLGKVLALTQAHNTVKVENAEQMGRIGPFMLVNWTKRGEYAHRPNVFSGEMSSANGCYTHKREVALSRDVISVTDKVESGGRPWLSLLHTPCGVDINENGDSADLLWGGRRVAVLACNGALEIQKCMRSLYYGRTEEITQIHMASKSPMDSLRWHISFSKEK